jgi:hypothetical protein
VNKYTFIHTHLYICMYIHICKYKTGTTTIKDGYDTTLDQIRNVYDSLESFLCVYMCVCMCIYVFICLGE